MVDRLTTNPSDALTLVAATGSQFRGALPFFTGKATMPIANRTAPSVLAAVAGAVADEASQVIPSRRRVISSAPTSMRRLSADEDLVDILELAQLDVPLGV